MRRSGLDVRRPILALLLASGITVPGVAGAITFNDGAVHTIDAANSFPVEPVVVQDGPSAATTVVNVIDGGVVGTGTFDYVPLQAEQHSHVTMTGGAVTDIVATDTSAIELSGGTVTRIVANGGSTISVSGGAVASYVEINQGSSALISGGRFDGDLEVFIHATVTVSSGTFQRVLADAGGGQGPNRLVVTGGTFHGRMHAVREATVTIFGGSFESDLVAEDDSTTVVIVGSEFNVPFGPVAALSGTLTGTLADGTPVSIPFARATSARIVIAAMTDSDGDGVLDGLDDCPLVSDLDQVDTDRNGVGDACNDAEDADGDEIADGLDNCPAVANTSQSDRDHDGVGDACDPFPDDADNDQARCQSDLGLCQTTLGTCQAALAACLVTAIPDADGDGEIDANDRCPGTPPGAPVDGDGCSREQFCARFDVATRNGARACRNADWRNDEPVMRLRDAADCTVERGSVPGSSRCTTSGLP